MKKLAHLLIIITVLLGLGYVIRKGVLKQHGTAAEITETAGHSEATGDAEEHAEGPAVLLEKERAEALGIQTAPPRKMELAPRRMAYGSVMDASPLVILEGDVTAAEAALAASRAENERTFSLAATSDASKKAVEASLSQFQADRIKVEALTRGAQMQWGSVFDGDAQMRQGLANEIISGSTVLVRVDLLPGEALKELPKGAQILILGREEQPIPVTAILPAMAADPKTQAQGFLLVVKNPPFSLRPGMALTSWLELSAEPEAGFVLPRSAIIRHDGGAWVYLRQDAGDKQKYVREPALLVSPLNGEQGWFVSSSDGLNTGAEVVVVGAASLLSEELKAQAGGGEE